MYNIIFSVFTKCSLAYLFSFWLTNLKFEQMHRAAFALPSFAKKELASIYASSKKVVLFITSSKGELGPCEFDVANIKLRSSWHCK